MSESSREVSIEDEIAQLRMTRPHVVLMGAGASLAACPSGDKFGRRLPVMANLVEMLSLEDRVPASQRSDFEGAYSALVANPAKTATARIVEERIYDYFDKLVLPDEPTIYDHLVLSLRTKDVIATFNWDPFLIQALRRNGQVLRASGCPTVLFLHGNVLEGHCVRDRVFGVKGAACSQCNEPFVPSRLLYPVTKKDYASDGFLNDSWRRLSEAFKIAFMVTIFGYSAPKSDGDAVRLLKTAWGRSKDREMEQFELIDIRDEASLVKSWKGFIHTHHYNVEKECFSSSAMLHPRRTGEDFMNRIVEARWTTPNPPPRTSELRELHEWYQPLLLAERKTQERALPNAR